MIRMNETRLLLHFIVTFLGWSMEVGAVPRRNGKGRSMYSLMNVYGRVGEIKGLRHQKILDIYESTY